jgi:hypothetical protein
MWLLSAVGPVRLHTKHDEAMITSMFHISWLVFNKHIIQEHISERDRAEYGYGVLSVVYSRTFLGGRRILRDTKLLVVSIRVYYYANQNATSNNELPTYHHTAADRGGSAHLHNLEYPGALSVGLLYAQLCC